MQQDQANDAEASWNDDWMDVTKDPEMRMKSWWATVGNETDGKTAQTPSNHSSISSRTEESVQTSVQQRAKKLEQSSVSSNPVSARNECL